MRRSFPAAAVAALTLMPVSGAGAGVPSPGATLSQVRVAGGLASQTLRNATSLGATAADVPARALISLRHRNQAGLLAFIAAVSNPRSARYQHYLTPSQFVTRYAPSRATVSAVEHFARSAGLRVASVPSNRAYVLVTGTVGQVDRAFSTSIGSFRLHGTTVQAPTRALRLPTSIAGAVSAVDGLNTADVFHPQDTPPAPAYVNAPPFSTAWGDTTDTTDPGYGGLAHLPYVVRGYTAKQLEGAYGVAGAIAHGLTGAGTSVAVIDAYSSPTIQTDVATWSSRHGLPKANLTVLDTPSQRSAPEAPTVSSDLPIAGVQDPQGWFGEETLDVEAVHAMAPGAHIVMHGANSAQSADLHMAQNDVVANNLAQIVSNSYGSPADVTDDTSDGYWQQAAAQGIGVYFASGDAGDQTSGGTDASSRSVDGGSNSPYVTAVGGTTLAVNPHDGYGFETYWGTESAARSGSGWAALAWNSGGGGGESTVYAEPSYQKGVADGYASYWKTHTCGACGTGLPASTPADPALSSAPVVPGRVVPDVASLGDPNSGFLMGQTMDFSSYNNPLGYALPGDDVHYGEYRIGGTSLASPLFAGMMALADQAAGKRHGFANPALYKLYGKSGTFHDVVKSPNTVAVVRDNYDNNTNPGGGTTPFLRTAGNLGTLQSATGYDDSTGLGTPDGLGFLAGLAPGSAKLASIETALGSKHGTGPGATTKRGPVFLLTCVRRHHLRVCRSRRLAVRVALGGIRSAALTRGRTVFATGAVRRGAVLLRARRTVRRGAYSLVIRRRVGRRTVRTAQSIVVR